MMPKQLHPYNDYDRWLNPRYPSAQKDYYGWLLKKLSLVQEKKRVIESNFEDMLGDLIAILLRIEYRPKGVGSWEASLFAERSRIKDFLKDNSTLAKEANKFIPNAYKKACALIKEQTEIDLNLLPKIYPYSFEKIMDSEFYPE